ncbi:MAG: hypothetical protein Q7T03_02245 [Deltaproteobacteria bacterium]|nr:hypothetical protein [Deltaproteobacteria bacterium]
MTLNRICKSIYRVKDQGELIKKCAENPENVMLGQEVLDQIQEKCGSVMPLSGARTCASELGLSVPDELSNEEEPAGQEEGNEQGIVVMGPNYKTTAGKCEQQYMVKALDYEGYKKCVLGVESTEEEPAKSEEQEGGKEQRKINMPAELVPTYHPTYKPTGLGKGIPEALDRLKKIEELHEERESLTVWGKFAFRLGLDYSKRYTLFKDAFKEWNLGEHTIPASYAGSHDATIDRGWRKGMRLALTTEPGLTRLKDSNVLFRGTLLDLTLWDQKKRGFAVNNNVFAQDSVIVGDNTQLTLFDLEWQIPFFERNFFEIGTSLVKEDILWWKNSNPWIFVPMNVHTGINWQFQGTPVTVSDRVLDTSDMAYILSSYTMFGLNTEFSGVNLYPSHKGSEFCSQVSHNCKREDHKLFPHDTGASGVSFDPDSDHIDNHFQTKLTAQLFGEQRGFLGALVYRGYADYYPLWQKTEAGVTGSYHHPLGRAMEFYIEGRFRNLWSSQKDRDVLLPDNAMEYGGTVGLGFMPSAVF